MSRKKKWSELSSTEMTIILTAASIELSLTATAAVDLARRPKESVHGSKALWALALVVQPVGPIAYLWTHRR
ncbi:MAG: PLD nuclease N-terminal domain-containing protein [Candidatus Nanopelagicales bacterium]